MARMQVKSEDIQNQTIRLEDIADDFLGGVNWNITNGNNNALITGLKDGSNATDISTINNLYTKLDNLSFQGIAISATDTPPATPNEGDRYVVIATATGDFTGHENDIAEYRWDSWHFITPVEGYQLYITGSSDYFVFDGTQWIEIKNFLGIENYSFSNGLTLDTSNVVKLGGSLEEDTMISGDYNLSITTNKLTLDDATILYRGVSGFYEGTNFQYNGIYNRLAFADKLYSINGYNGDPPSTGSYADLFDGQGGYAAWTTFPAYVYIDLNGEVWNEVRNFIIYFEEGYEANDIVVYTYDGNIYSTRVNELTFCSQNKSVYSIDLGSDVNNVQRVVFKFDNPCNGSEVRVKQLVIPYVKQNPFVYSVYRGGDKMFGDLDMGSNQIKNVADPIDLQDVVTLNYFNSHSLAVVGNDKEILYNYGGSGVGADSDFTWDYTANILKVSTLEISANTINTLNGDLTLQNANIDYLKINGSDGEVDVYKDLHISGASPYNKIFWDVSNMYINSESLNTIDIQSTSYGKMSITLDDNDYIKFTNTVNGYSFDKLLKINSEFGSYGDLIIYTDVVDTNTKTERMRISSVTGRVGINTSSPSEMLDVDGYIRSRYGHIINRTSFTIVSGTTGWYRFAYGTNRNGGLFKIKYTASGYHGEIYVYVSSYYSNAPQPRVELWSKTYYGSNVIPQQLRLLRNTSSAYNEMYIELYVDNLSTSNCTIYIEQLDRGIDGWNIYSTVGTGSIPTDYTYILLNIASYNFVKKGFNVDNNGYLTTSSSIKTGSTFVSSDGYSGIDDTLVVDDSTNKILYTITIKDGIITGITSSTYT